MGNQKKSHNLSLDSPRKKKGQGKNEEGHELIQSHRVNETTGMVAMDNGGIPHLAGKSLNHTYHGGVFDKVMDRVSMSPPL